MEGYSLDHIGIVVADLDEATARWQLLTGLEVTDRQIVPRGDVEVVYLRHGPTQLELIAPREPASGVAQYLAKRGESVHHMAFRVKDIVGELAALTSRGFEPIDKEPRPGSHGDIAFLHPRSTGGVLIELVQLREAHEPD